MAGEALGLSQPGNMAFNVATSVAALSKSTHTVAVWPLFKAMHSAPSGVLTGARVKQSLRRVPGLLQRQVSGECFSNLSADR
jgi:hypothetical protein